MVKSYHEAASLRGWQGLFFFHWKGGRFFVAKIRRDRNW